MLQSLCFTNFDRRYYQLLFTRARTHAAQAFGKEIVKTAYGLHPFVLVTVDIHGSLGGRRGEATNDEA